MKDPVVVKVNVAASTDALLRGTRNQLIAKELQCGGITAAVAGPNGIHVTSGTLDTYEEDGLRVFTWQPEDVEEKKVVAEEETADDVLEETTRPISTMKSKKRA